MIKTLSDLDVFNISFRFAMDMFVLSRSFPKEERYSLTDQLVRSSRSISANIAEGWGKRIYENEFKKHFVYAMGSLEETKTWILFAKDCGYINNEKYQTIFVACEEIGAKIYKLFQNWKS
ncbi:MAG: four helix bundle protein [Chitinophagales bacterium]